MDMGTAAARVMGLTLLYAKASVLYLAAGVTMLLLLFSRLFPVDIFAFFFMQLYGFVAMMIFGVSYSSYRPSLTQASIVSGWLGGSSGCSTLEQSV
jgi:hypothetical protein